MEKYSVRKVVDTFFSIEEGGVRSFLLAGREKALLVDTGFGSGDLASIVKELTNKPILLVNTHADIDHIGKNAAFGPARMHPSEFTRYYEGTFAGFPVLPLWEGDAIDIGGRTIEIIHIPGHTPGSIALLDRANRFLIGGDSVQPGPTHMFGKGRNFPAYLASMEKLQRMARCFDVVYASHFDLEVPPSILSDLIDGAKQVISCKITGTDLSPDNRNYRKCKVYSYKGIKFLGESEGYGGYR